ncbi:autotransporter family protein [Pseudomonas oryzihabitans]|uniref:autotransporter family protein n=1 Tax=Pseudomonas oryzihabitans TaxID=47885 RepID=UPI00112447E1|nr:autotransporter outer membrane beta-barrel domain-containing protein [Pseudomonas psychrotolerans]QDD90651.1 autotransporter outer membrane beta-barrel domain-containing protein [Pseudomonas psychrotolerans]
MKPDLFKKTSLAIVIGTLAQHAFALDYDVSNGPRTFANQTISGPLQLIGSRTATLSARDQGFQVDNSSIVGDVVNNSNISLDANGFTTFVIGVQNYQYNNKNQSKINGNVINNGNIDLRNAGSAEIFEVGNAIISGSVINNGKISATRTTATSYGEPEAIYIHGAQIAGDVINNGTINAFGKDSTGLIFDGPGNLSIGGKIINTGTIHAEGEKAEAFDFEATANKSVTIENRATISSVGQASQAVSLFEGPFDQILNTGTIDARGQNAQAIHIEKANFTTTNPSGSRGLINQGTIYSDGTAILATDTQTSPFEINQQAGSITSASGTAISGHNVASLNWTGGQIQGDILGVTGTTVAGNATFVGAHHIDSDVNVNSGTFGLTTQGASIGGNLAVANGAALGLQLSNATQPTTPYLTVGGNASFANGSRIQLTAEPGNFTATAAGTQYTLVSANQVTNSGLTVASSSPLLAVSSYSSDNKTVKAVVTVQSDQQVSQELGAAGASPNDVRALNAFKNGVLGTLSSTDPLFQAFTSTSSPQTLARLSESLTPESNGGAVSAALAGQSATSAAIGGRLSGQRNGLSSGDVLTDTGIWIQGLTGSADQSTRDGIAGYSSNTSGIAIGADGKLNPATTLGLAYSYANTNVGSDNGNKTNVQSHLFTLYGSWTSGNWFTDGNLSYGRSSNEGKRYIVGTEAKGDYDGDLIALNALSGYTFQLNRQLVLEPRVAARYANVQTDAYTEHGSVAALRNGSQRYEQGEVGAGLRLAADLPLFQGTLKPEATLMAYHDLIGDRISQTSAFVRGGNSFIVTGASPVRDSYEGTLGVNYAIDAFTFGATYGYQAKSGYDANSMVLKARYDF